jgi:hypothetical protein
LHYFLPVLPQIILALSQTIFALYIFQRFLKYLLWVRKYHWCIFVTLRSHCCATIGSKVRHIRPMTKTVQWQPW